MYNCIQSSGWLPDAADRGRLYTVKLKLLDPRILLISDSRILFEQDTMQRNINCSYLRFFTYIIICILRPVSVGKTYRHLRFGGIASGARVICQQHNVLVSQTPHIFDSIVVKANHSDLPLFPY